MQILAAYAPTYPKAPYEHQVDVGLLLLGILACLFLWALARSETIRRGLLGLEDPRVYAVLRIGLALLTIQCFWNLEPYWRMLWSDEGIFSLTEAQSRYGSSALAGWTRSDGFDGLWAWLRFFWGKSSLFFIHGSPQFVTGYMLVFFGLLLAYALGLRARVTGFLAYFAMIGVYSRNSLYSEGTDTVFKCLFFLMLFARTDAAWSLDNVIRVRAHRRYIAACKRFGKPVFNRWKLGDRLFSVFWAALWITILFKVVNYPFTQVVLFAIAGIVLAFSLCWFEWLAQGSKLPTEIVRYVLVPRWPRLLIMFQLAWIYCKTGAVKTGHVWAKGDALYYALNMDHFYRFENITQVISAYLGMGMFRISTWVVHFWEIAFPLLLIGMILRFQNRHASEPWFREQASHAWRNWLSRLSLLSAYLLIYRVAFVSYPFLLALKKNGDPIDASIGLKYIHYAFAVYIPVLVIVWIVLHRFPLQLLAPGKKFRKWTLPGIRIDSETLRAWLLGRRIWLGLGLIFHGFLLLFMSIGLFPHIMMLTYVAYTTSGDWVRLLRRCFDWGQKFTLVRKLLPSQAPAWMEEPKPAPTQPISAPLWQDPIRGTAGIWITLQILRGKRDRDALHDFLQADPRTGGRIPDLVFFLLGITCLASVSVGPFLRRYQLMTVPRWLRVDLEQTSMVLAAVSLFAAVLVTFRKRPRLDQSSMVEQGPVLAQSSVYRVVAALFFFWHASAISLTLSPDYPIFSVWRPQARSLISSWTSGTNTRQSWRMFSPNPPRSNTFMQTIVVDAENNHWDLLNNSFDYRPNPWIVNDRMRKMQRRMIGKSKWYLTYWAKFQCREWLLRTGEMPDRIVIKKLTTRIPPPSKTFMKPYRPRDLPVSSEELKNLSCGVTSNLSAEMKRRRGIPLTDNDLKEEEKMNKKMKDRDERARKSWNKRKNFGGNNEQ